MSVCLSVCLCFVVEIPEKQVGLTCCLSPTMSLCQETVVKRFANYTMSVSPTAQQATKAR